MPQPTYDFLRARGQQDLVPGYKELLNTSPCVSNQARASTCGFKHSCGRREADIGHRFSIDIQYHPRRAVNPTMSRARNVSDPADVGRQILATPTLTAENK